MLHDVIDKISNMKVAFGSTTRFRIKRERGRAAAQKIKNGLTGTIPAAGSTNRTICHSIT